MEPGVGLLRGERFFREGSGLFVNRVEENFLLRYHAHDFYEIAYVSRGRGFHHVNGRVVPVAKGDAFLLPIGLAHVFRPASADEGERLVITNCAFSEQLLREAASVAGALDVRRTFEGDGVAAVRDIRFTLEPIFDRMLEECRRPTAGSEGMLFGLFLQLLVQLVRMANRETPAPALAGERERGADDDAIGDAIDYIRRHLGERLTAGSLAKRCGMSERHFFRLFKERTGQPFLEYVQRQRMRVGCELLRSTRHKIGAIAEMTGYRDMETFHRTFKRWVGMTPGEYRKRAGASAPRL